jgi:hypothetical protein
MPIPVIYPVPNPQTRKGAIIAMSICTAVFLAFTIFFFVQWSNDQQAAQKDTPRFDTLPIDQLESGLDVHGTIDLAFDYYAETYTTDYGIRTSSDSDSLYYVIPVYDADGYFAYLISFEAYSSNFDTMDQIVTQTWTETDDLATLTLEHARIESLPEEIRQYLEEWSEDTTFYDGGSFIDWCAEYGIFGTQDKSLIRAKLVPYVIEESNPGSAVAGFIFLGFTVASLILLLVLIFRKKSFKTITGIDDGADSFRALRDMDSQSDA